MAVANWLILELCDFIDNITYKDIEGAITVTFGEGIEYFIPMHHEEMGSYTSTSTLMDGYVFVKDCPEARDCLLDMKDQRLFSKVLCKKGEFITVNSRTIAGLKHKLSNSLKKRFVPGTNVKILGGVFKNLIGEVIGVEDKGLKIMVRIKRRSREMIAPIPATLMEKV